MPAKRRTVFLLIAALLGTPGLAATGAGARAGEPPGRSGKSPGAVLGLNHAEVLDGGIEVPTTIGLRTDSSGNIYVVGGSNDPHFPAPATGFGTGDIYDNCYWDCSYVIKYDADFNPVYTAIIGGSEPYAMALDSQGDVFVAGAITDLSQFPFTPGAYLTGPGSAGGLGFVTEINPSGTGLVYSTAMDHLDGENGIVSIVLDSSDDCYFLSSSPDPNFPVTPDAIQSALGGYDDAVVGEFDSTGSELLFGTYLGGSGQETPYAMYGDPGGTDLYVVGSTKSTDFPVTMGSYAGGDDDGFVAKIGLLPQKTLDYARYLGGSGDETLTAITGAGDGSSDVFVAGDTSSSDFPVTPGAYQTTLGGRASAFVTRLAPDGTIVASTLFGGAGAALGFTEAMALAPDGFGGVYSGGATSWFEVPTSRGAVQDYNVPSNDIFLLDSAPGVSGYLTEFTADLSATGYSTLYGGNTTPDYLNYLNPAYTSVNGLWAGGDGELYAVGLTDTTDFPLTVYSPDNRAFTQTGGADGFWSRYGPEPLVIDTPTYLPLEILGQSYAVALSASGGTPPYTWSVAAESAPAGIAVSQDGTVSGVIEQSDIPPGYIYYHRDFTLAVTDAAGHTAYKGFDLPWDYPLRISGPAVAYGKVGSHFGEDYGCTGTCKLASGRIPPGTQLLCNVNGDPGCVVTGTPTTPDTYQFGLFASDRLGQQVTSQNFQIVVSEPKTSSGGGGGGATAPATPILLGLLGLLSLYRRKRRI